MQFDFGEQFVFLVKKSVYTRMFANISTANFYVMNEADVWLCTKQMRADNGDNSQLERFCIHCGCDGQHRYRGTMQRNETREDVFWLAQICLNLNGDAHDWGDRV